MALRYYSSTATPNTLASGINNTDTTTNSTTTTALSGWPSTTPFTAALDLGTASEEVVLVTAVSGTTVTMTRGYDGTSKRSHSAGASLTHVSTSLDFTEANVHTNATGNVHGLGPADSFVGTNASQTLANKTLTNPTISGTGWGNANHNHSGATSGGAIPQGSVTGLTADLAAKATDNAVVHLAGFEAVTGSKAFQGGIGVFEGAAILGGTTTDTLTATGTISANGGLAVSGTSNALRAFDGSNNVKVAWGSISQAVGAGGSASPTVTISQLTTLNVLIPVTNVTNNNNVTAVPFNFTSNHCQIFLSNTSGSAITVFVSYIAIGT